MSTPERSERGPAASEHDWRFHQAPEVYYPPPGPAATLPFRHNPDSTAASPKVLIDEAHFAFARAQASYPEVVLPTADNYPELAQSQLPEIAKPPDNDSAKQVAQDWSHPACSLSAHSSDHAHGLPPPPLDRASEQGTPTWWRRRRAKWLIAAGLVVAVLSIVLGVVFGLGLYKSHSQKAPTSEPSSVPGAPEAATMPSGNSKCRDAVCTEQLAAVANSADPTAAPVVYLFARATDGSWKQATSAPGGGSYPGGWISRGGTFAHPPATLLWSTGSDKPSWGEGSTVSLIGVSNGTKSFLVKNIGLATNTGTEFRDMRNPSTGPVEPPALCTIGTNRVDVFARVEVFSHVFGATSNRTTPGIIHKYVRSEQAWDDPTTWEASGAGELIPASRPAVVCRDGQAFHDVVVYENGTGVFQAWHRQYRSTDWLPWQNLGGDYANGTHPVLVEVSARRFDFFGLGSDARLRRWSWEEGRNYSATEVLGDERLGSVPAAVLAGEMNDRIELLAVGKDDGRLRHLSLGLSLPTANTQWEDLGVVAAGAPTLVRLGQLPAVEMLVTAVDGSVWAATVNISSSSNGWGKPVWKPIPGL